MKLPHLGLRERRYLDACTASLFLLAVLPFKNGVGASITVAAGIASIWTTVVAGRVVTDCRNPQPADPPDQPKA